MQNVKYLGKCYTRLLSLNALNMKSEFLHRINDSATEKYGINSSIFTQADILRTNALNC